jgi:O-antigen ligase
MSTLFSGVGPDRHRIKSTQRKLPILWTLAIIAMLAVFYAANVYDRALSSQLFALKWISVLPVMMISWHIMQLKNYGLTSSLNPWPLMLIGLSAFASVFAASDTLASAAVFVSIVLAFTSSYLMASAILKTKSEQQFFAAIALVGRSVIVLSAIFHALGLNLGRSSQLRFSGWTDNPNTLALLLAPAIVVLLAEIIARRRAWLWWSLPFLLVGIFLLFETGSRSGILWIVASLGGFYAFRQGIGISFVLGFITLLISVPYWDVIIGSVISLAQREGVQATNNVLSGRSEVWSLGLQLISERPIFGYGIGTSQDIIPNYKWMFAEHQGAHFHNSYMTVAVELGLTGLLACFVMFAMTAISAAKMSLNARAKTAAGWPIQALPWALFAGALAHGFFETSLMSAGNANMILIWTCMLLVQGGASSKSRIRRTS